MMQICQGVEEVEKGNAEKAIAKVINHDEPLKVSDQIQAL